MARAAIGFLVSYILVGVVMLILIQIYEALKNWKEYIGSIGEQGLVAIAVLLAWPLGVAMEIRKLWLRANAKRKGKTWWNGNLGAWDFPSNKEKLDE